MISAKFSDICFLHNRQKFIGSITHGQIIEERNKKKCKCFIYNPLSPDYKSNKKYF